MPANIEPMLATLATKPFSDPDWLYEIKWDGFRVQAVIDERKVRVWTRNLKDATHVLPEAAVVADLDRGPPGDRRRRGRGPRRGRPARLQPAPGAPRQRDGPGAHLPGVRPALPRRPVPPQRAPRGPQAPAQERAQAPPARPLRGARGRGGTAVLRGGAGPGPRGHHRQAPPFALRAWPAVGGVAQAQGPARAGARGRRLDAR